MNTSETSAVVLIEKPGAPDVLKYETVALQQPGPGEVLIDQKAIGVNYVDVFFRNGTFPMPAYPSPIGLEAAGVVTAIGAGVTEFAVGDRIAYHSAPGAYAEKRVLNASDIFRLPADITFDHAAAVMLKGLTAHMLVTHSHKVKAGDVVLIHAMTGGVGTLLSYWARSLGATVIGTVGSAAKKGIALARGFAHVVNLQAEDFADKVNEVTQGAGIDAVYDGTGEATFAKSLILVKNGGSAVLYGWSSGMPVVDEALIAQKHIQYVHPALNSYLADKEQTAIALAEVFEHVRRGTFALQSSAIYALADAATAHADLESRKTTGSIVLHP
jgi:NADPH2:quinone reductase